MYIGLLSILLLCLQFGFTQEVSVFNNSNEYMEHLDLVSNTFLKKKKERKSGVAGSEIIQNEPRSKYQKV